MAVATDKTLRMIGGLIAAATLSVAAPTGCASAQPPGFPDLNSFSPVPADDYIVSNFRGTPGSRSMTFDTPYGLHCVMDASNPKTLSSTGIRCSGKLPDSSTDDCSSGTVDGTGPAGSYRITPEPGGCSLTVTGGSKQLGVGQKTTYQNVTCAVGADQLIACLDTTSGHHGFVLRPSGSEAF